MMRILVILLASLMLFSCQSTDAPTVSVTGSAVVETVPDILKFELAASATCETSAEAVSTASGIIAEAVDILSLYGVQTEDIRTEYFSISPSYSYIDGKEVLEGQMAIQRLSVILRDMEKAGETVDALSALDGIEISGLYADKSDKSMERMKARELAVHDAYEKASVYAAASGYVLGDLISISGTSRGYAPVAEARVYSASAGSGTSYYSGAIEVSDEISAVFFLSE